MRVLIFNTVVIGIIIGSAYFAIDYMFLMSISDLISQHRLNYPQPEIVVLSILKIIFAGPSFHYGAVLANVICIKFSELSKEKLEEIQREVDDMFDKE